jgi:hypothetical protein
MVTVLLSDLRVFSGSFLGVCSGVTKMAYHVDSVLGGSGNRVSELA